MDAITLCQFTAAGQKLPAAKLAGSDQELDLPDKLVHKWNGRALLKVDLHSCWPVWGQGRIVLLNCIVPLRKLAQAMVTHEGRGTIVDQELKKFTQ